MLNFVNYLVVLSKLMSLNFCLYYFLNEIVIIYWVFVCIISTHFYDLDLSQFMMVRVHSPRSKQSVNVKFMYSEKAAKFCEISTLLLSYVVPVKSKVEILQNFVAFSEYMNFNVSWFGTFLEIWAKVQNILRISHL